MDTLELLAKARAGDLVVRDRIIEENLGLVWSVVRRFLNRGYESEDLFQIGCIGLIQAVDRFDPSYDVKFSTYAVPMIAGQIKRFLRDDGMIKVSRTLKENNWKIQRMAEQIQHDKGRSASVQEIAAALELETEDVLLALEANREVETIDRTIGSTEGKEIPLVDMLQGSPDGEIGSMLDKMTIRQLMDELEPRERMLIEYRYYKDMTQSQVAKCLKISQVQVSRLEKKILQKLQEKLIS